MTAESVDVAVATNDYLYEYNLLISMINDIEKDDVELQSQLNEVIKAREALYDAQGEAIEKQQTEQDQQDQQSQEATS